MPATAGKSNAIKDHQPRTKLTVTEPNQQQLKHATPIDASDAHLQKHNPHQTIHQNHKNKLPL